jgi:hypothetical protein
LELGKIVASISARRGADLGHASGFVEVSFAPASLAEISYPDLHCHVDAG